MDIRFLMEQDTSDQMNFDPDTQITSDDQLYLKEGKISKQELLWMLLNKKNSSSTSLMEISSKFKKVKFQSHIASSVRLLILQT